MIKVYKILNADGHVEHVGSAADLDDRFYRHTKLKPAMGCGKFYRRKDVTIELISEWPTRAEAKKAEMYWQAIHNVRDQQFNNRKLNDQQVDEIRNSTETNNALAEMYGVHHNTISSIRNNRFYKI